VSAAVAGSAVVVDPGATLTRRAQATARGRLAARTRAATALVPGLVVAAALLVATPAVAATAVPTTQHHDSSVAVTNTRLVREAFDAWAAGTGSVFDLLHEDLVWTVAGTSPVSGTYTSRADFLARAVQPINARLATPITPQVQHVVAEGDAVVVVWDGTATAHDGRPYRNSYAWHMVLDGGRILRVVAFLDTWALQALMVE
jgi:ketosteroid isomerase-like protein